VVYDAVGQLESGLECQIGTRGYCRVADEVTELGVKANRIL